ncbi:hypothetical protein ISN45_Aa06g004620 [Arabidopsis thaliana x Arabidopsis arenosa]|uniref:Uncharacterized protein n=1 Tax=Arabidopsis thaliana x Arabidopsis arenosa TaxID=1240361 RepID=A0A8T1YSZ2_9BRAS|nr:hypothetical protein ISN45_Aa06g004620 [Arabidopsis thaliana x Arabidopsis arenosa]
MILREGTPFESKILGTSLFPCFYVFRCLSLESGDVKNHIVTIERGRERERRSLGFCSSSDPFLLILSQFPPSMAACSSSVRSDSLDAPLLLSNSSYAFIANTGWCGELLLSY